MCGRGLTIMKSGKCDMQTNAEWRLILDQEDPDPRYWSMAVKLAWHLAQADRLIDSRPDLAELWLAGADLLRAQMQKDTSHA